MEAGVPTWKVREDVAAWLQGLGLERYAPAFRDNEIDGDALPKLSAEDLKHLGVVLGGHRRRLLDAIVEGLAAPDLMITDVQRRALSGQQNAKAILPLLKRPRVKGFAIEVEEIEQEKDERIALACIRRVLDQAEGGGAIGANAAQLPVEIGLSRRQRRDRRRDRRIFMRPVEPGAGQQPDRAPVQPGMDAVPIELELVQPFPAFRRLINQLSELRFDPTGERRRFSGLPSREDRIIN